MVESILGKKIELMPRELKPNQISCPKCEGIGWLHHIEGEQKMNENKELVKECGENKENKECKECKERNVGNKKSKIKNKSKTVNKTESNAESNTESKSAAT